MPGTDAFGWGLVPLGSTCNINPKKSLDSRLVSGAMVSFVPMPAVTEHGEIDATAIKEYDEVKTGFTYFAENDVLFAKITPCMENGKGAVAKGLHNGIGFGSTEFHVLRPISGKTDPYWIYTLTAFSQFRMDAASNMTGSAGQRRVPASFLENYRVSLPPIALQEQFAAFVEQTDKSRFIELFGDCDLTHPQESWVTIKEIGSVVGGATPKTDHDEYWGGSYRWITPAELDADSGYIYDSVRKLTKAGVESCSLQEMPVGTVILSSRAPIGKVAIAGNTFYCNQGFKNIICKEGITPRYLYTVLLLNVEYLNSLGRGATFKEISKGIVESIRIPVPSMELQEQFAAFVEQTDKSKLCSKMEVAA